MRPLTNFAGIGAPVQASMTGLQGAWLARLVNVPSATAIKRIVSTAIGRRFQLFSPSPEKKGSNSKTINAFTTGGHYVYIYDALFQMCKNEDELAAVMAHEYGHIHIDE